jgi:hypothetical protein
MYVDSRNTFAAASSAATTGLAATVVGSQIDLGSVGRDLGVGQPLYLVAKVDSSIVGTTGAGSFTLQLVTATDAALTGSPVTVATSPSYVTNTTAQAGSTAGSVLWNLIVPTLPLKQYLGIKVVPVTRDISAGSVTCFLAEDRPTSWVHMPDALAAGQ